MPRMTTIITNNIALAVRVIHKIILLLILWFSICKLKSVLFNDSCPDVTIVDSGLLSKLFGSIEGIASRVVSKIEWRSVVDEISYVGLFIISLSKYQRKWQLKTMLFFCIPLVTDLPHFDVHSSSICSFGWQNWISLLIVSKSVPHSPNRFVLVGKARKYSFRCTENSLVFSPLTGILAGLNSMFKLLNNLLQPRGSTDHQNIQGSVEVVEWIAPGGLFHDDIKLTTFKTATLHTVIEITVAGEIPSKPMEGSDALVWFFISKFDANYGTCVKKIYVGWIFCLPTIAT